MKDKQIKSILMIFFLALLITPCISYAETSDFTVSPELPKNQIGDNYGYFNLLMNPGTEQEVVVNLCNTTSRSITIEASFAHASTNGNGLAVYDLINSKNDDSLKYNIEDYVSFPNKEVKISAHSQTRFVSRVRMPKISFEGILAGGFSFKEKENSSHTDTQKGVSIVNEYRYVIALVLSQHNNIVNPQLHLNQVLASQVNSRNVISVNLQNTASTYLKDMNISATIRGVTYPNLEFSLKSYDMKMAPNSNFNLAIPVSAQGNMVGQNSKALKPGKYHLSITVYGFKNPMGYYETIIDGEKVKYQYKWRFERKFQISGKIAKKLNSSDPTIHDKEPIVWLIIRGMAIILCVMLLFILFFINKHRKKL